MEKINFMELSTQSICELLISARNFLATLQSIGTSNVSEDIKYDLNNILIKGKRELKERGIAWK